MKYKEYEYVIPAHMTVAIEYGDTSGLSEEDEAALDKFLDSLPKGNKVLSYGTLSEFTTENDILGRIGCDCVIVTLTIFNEQA